MGHTKKNILKKYEKVIFSKKTQTHKSSEKITFSFNEWGVKWFSFPIESAVKMQTVEIIWEFTDAKLTHKFSWCANNVYKLKC